MTVELTTTVERSVPANNTYRVAFQVVDAMGIELPVFCFDTEHSTYSHVSTVYDMDTYPAGQVAANTAGLQFYRAASVSRDFDNLLDATSFETVTRNRLKLLTVAWNSIVTAFTGNEVVVVTSSSES